MIRATLGLALVLLTGVAAVWWTARNLDPMRVLERIAPARVRTVGLTGSGPFPRERREPDPPARSGSASERGPAAVAKAQAAQPPTTPIRTPTPIGFGEPPGHPAAPLAPGPAVSGPSASPSPASPSLASRDSSSPLEPEATAPIRGAQRPPDSPGLASTAPSAPPPLHPEESAALIRRMLALYERAAEGQ